MAKTLVLIAARVDKCEKPWPQPPRQGTYTSVLFYPGLLIGSREYVASETTEIQGHSQVWCSCLKAAFKLISRQGKFVSIPNGKCIPHQLLNLVLKQVDSTVLLFDQVGQTLIFPIHLQHNQKRQITANCYIQVKVTQFRGAFKSLTEVDHEHISPIYGN